LGLGETLESRVDLYNESHVTTEPVSLFCVRWNVAPVRSSLLYKMSLPITRAVNLKKALSEVYLFQSASRPAYIKTYITRE
jgi:hypothetical protein